MLGAPTFSFLLQTICIVVINYFVFLLSNVLTIVKLFIEERLPELNKTTEYEFGNKEILIKTINTQLEAINNEISNPEIFQRLHLLINAVHRCSGQCFLGSKTYAFGSRMSGLALKESDVDLYFDIGNIIRFKFFNSILRIFKAP